MKSTAMRKQNFFSAVLSLFLLVPASITRAQTITTQKGLQTAVFKNSFGIIKVYLPEDIRPGDMISGTILAEPNGKSSRQLEKNLSALTGYKINLDGAALAIQSKKTSFQWKVSADKKNGVSMSLKQASGTVAGQLPILYEVKNTSGNAGQTCNIPSHALSGSPIRISGPFDGDASNTKCSLDGKPMDVLAESPRGCIVLYPNDASGLKTLDINEKGNPLCTQKASSVQLNVSAGKLNLLKGERTYIDVNISGLQNLPDTAILSLENLSINTVAMLPLNYVVLPLAPADAGSGTFNRRFDIQSLKTGDFSVNVNLDLPEANSGAQPMFDMRDLKNESGYPGSYGYKGNEPCNPEGATIKWRWHKTFACEIDDRKVLPCGHSKEGNDVYEKLKELLEELELDKATDIGEKMSKAFSTAKTFSYSIHVIRKWVDYDIEYKCVNGKWQPTGGVYVKHGTDDLGWHSVKHPSTDCWMTFDSPAAEKEFEAALENALRNACK